MYDLWVWFLLLVGVLTIVILISKWFLAIGRSLPPLRATDVPTVDTPQFLEALSMAVDADVNHGGSVELLNNGDEFFSALMEDIRNAKRAVHVMTYIWVDGQIARDLFNLLAEKARSGVAVRVMMDGLGGAMFPKSLMYQVCEAGGQVEWFSPMMSVHLLHFNRRNHRRAFVIDGNVAYTGGAAIADCWSGSAQDQDHWRDVMVRLTGHASMCVHEAFMQLWVNIIGEIPCGEGYVPSLSGEGKPRERAVCDSESEPLRHLGMSHNPSIHIQPLRQTFWLSFRAAHEKIFVANAYFAPDEYTRQELVDKAKSGVDVRLLLPSANTDARLVRWFAQRYYDEFLVAGIRIYEYQPTMFHAKYLVIDRVWTLLGSANLDVRSFQLNDENVLGIQHNTFGGQVEDMFYEDLSKAKEIKLDQWRGRPWWHRIRESAVLPLWAQY